MLKLKKKMVQLLVTATTHRFFIYFICFGLICTFIIFSLFRSTNSSLFSTYSVLNVDYRQRPECKCLRPELPLLNNSISNQTDYQSSLCSSYATRRGPKQRVISISIFGPKENSRFQLNQSLIFLNALINDMNKIYSDNFLLRIHHDNTLDTLNVICPMECKHPNVDFCNMSSKLYMPPKIWRFIPAGDPLVDVMMSRDLDSALTARERAAVNVWLASNKLFHAMRDHPMHGVPMLGGMWGFRPSLNSSVTRFMYDKIHNKDLVQKYGGRGDQTFLSRQIWQQAKSSIIVHDSFLCQDGYGQKPDPFPTERPSANETNCFVGCVRPCCGKDKYPFHPCPLACRPKDHQNWTYC